MIWLAWRQQRAETLIALAMLGVLVALFVPSGLRLASDFDEQNLDACIATVVTDSCADRLAAFEQSAETLHGLTSWFGLAPILVAILFAAPLVLELERRSYRLAWTQGITRRRWVATKFGFITASTLGFSALLAGLMMWWRVPLDEFQGRIEPTSFQLVGVVPVAYALFAVALILAIGTITRRVIPAIGLGIAAFLAIRVAVEIGLRPRLEPALTAVRDSVADSAWIIDNTRTTITYQPNDRFWSFQAMEAGLFVSLSLALFALAAWWMLRRVE